MTDLQGFFYPQSSTPQTPQQIAYQQQLANALSQEGSSYAPVASPWQGAARLAQALAGAIGSYKAGQAQNLSSANLTADRSNLLNENGVYNDPGNLSIPATPGQTTPALQTNDALNDAVSDAQDSGTNPRQALAAAIAANGGTPGGANAVSTMSGNPTQAAMLANQQGGSPQTPAPFSGNGALGVNGDARGMRNNNPGNLEANAWTASLPGYAGSDGRFAIFNSLGAGQAALDRNLAHYGQQGISTPLGIASTWAPGSEQGNNPGSYGATIARALGVGLNDQVNMSDPATRARIGQAISFVENGPARGGAAPAVSAINGLTGSPSAMGNPSPSAADLAQLSAAMQPQGSASPWGLIGSANAAQPYANSALAMADGLHAPMPAGGASPAAAAQLSGVDSLSPAAAASPLAQPAVPPSSAVPMPPPRPADLGGAPVAPADAQPATPAPSAAPPAAPSTIPGYAGGDVSSILNMLSNPAATPADQQLAQQMLQMHMPQRPTIIEGPTDPDTGYGTKLLWSPTQGILGRLNANGSITPVGAADAATSTNSATAPPVPAGVDPAQWRKTLAEIAAKRANPTASDELDFAGKLTERPSYKEYAASLPTANSLPNLAKENSPAGDTGIIDSVAKIVNPGLAVRQGTYQVYQDEQSGLNRFLGEIDKVIHQNAVLQPDTRAQLMRIANEKMQQYQSAWQTDANQATKIAKANGLDPDRVVPQLPDLAPLNLTSISSQHTQAYPVAPGANGGPAAPQPPAPGAKQAPDGNWYVSDPARPGKYLRVN